MEILWQDIRFGIRMLARSPGFTAIAILTLALGIGANTTIFSVINTVFLTPMSFPNPDTLVTVWRTDLHDPSPENFNIFSLPNFRDVQQQNQVFDSMALFDSAGKGYNLSGEKEPEQVSGLRVSAGFFQVLGVKPYLGRGFLPEEETRGKNHEVVLSYGLWKNRYSGDPSLVGRTVRIDSEAYTVVGVMPSDFHFQFWGSQRQLWVPAGYTDGDQGRGSNSFLVIARLKPGISLAQAQAQMDTIGRRLAQEYPDDNAGQGVTTTPASQLGARARWQTLLALFAAVGFVLLIACVNVANLMLARSAARHKEIAIRSSLGASRTRVVRQLLTESLLLAIAGGCVGLIVAIWTTNLLFRILPENIKSVPLRSIDAVTIDGRVFTFTLVVSCLAGILFGLLPAFTGFRHDLNDPLKDAGRGTTQGQGSRLGYALVASEIALALVVLAGAGLMIESMSRLLRVPPGLDPKNVLTMEMSVPQVDLYYGPPVNPRFCHDVAERVGAVPGVLSVGSVSHLPIGGGMAGRGVTIEGSPDPGRENQPGANYSVACPNYFHTMGIPVVAGREFTDQDALSSPGVIVVNETMARRFWPKQNAVGKRLKIGGFDSPAPWLTVVGVTQDVHHNGLDQQADSQLFRPYTHAAWPLMTVVVRTASAPASFAGSVKKAIAEVEPEHPVSDFEAMEDVVKESVGPRRFPMLLLAVFALLALSLAAVGIAGVVGYSVVQRTHEVGIRMALGAQPRDILRMIVGRSMVWAVVGVALGIAGAIGLTRLLSSLLFGVKPADPLILAIVSVLLAAVALLASYLPARQATKIDPMTALRWE
jgi:putative ABC transport system permease protein